MADTIRKMGYFYSTEPDEPGAGARALAALRERGINLLAFHGFPESGGAQLDFVPADEKKFLDAAEEAGIDLSDRKTVFLIEGADRPGACAEVLQKLADAKINVTAMDAVAAGGRYGALLWVKPGDVDKAGKALGAR